MIGIFGLMRADPAAPADAGPMASRLPNRYDVETTSGPGAVLGRVSHDRSRGGGMASSADGRWRAVVCGEIFNPDSFADLADDTGAEEFDNAAVLILRLAESGSLDRLAEINGQFCAALYDRAEHCLILLTDRLATHPVHVWRQGGETVFASQLHTLIGDERVPRRADPSAIAQLFTMQRTVGRISPLAGVSALPAACIAEFDRNGARERAYWRLAWRKPDFSRHEGAELLAIALRRAVDRQSRPDGVGLLLSGGIDSRLVLGATGGDPPGCWTTASFAGNPELATAKRIARARGAKHTALVVDPGETLDILDDTVMASGGLYPASTPVSAFMPRVAESCRVALTGHGIDYTLRGYYLPARFINILGSRTRVPALRPISRPVGGGDVLDNLRQGPPRATVDRIVRAERRAEWWRGQADAMQGALAPWLDSDEPYNAWDGFILHAVSKHYAFTSMMAVRAEVDLRIPAFDNEVFDIYLRMPPAWRCNGRMLQLALGKLAPDLATIPNANTDFRADLHPWMEIAGLLGRGALRRLGILRHKSQPSASHSLGSWQNLGALYRQDPGHRQRFAEIRGRLDGLTMGVMDSDGLASCIDEHLDGRAEHTKLMRQLLTHDSWVRTFGISGHG